MYKVNFCLILMMLSFSAFARSSSLLPDKEHFHLYLLAGQSNMAGRGVLDATNRVPCERVLKLDGFGRWVSAEEPIHFDKPGVSGAGLSASFARQMADADASVTVGLIPCAFGGTSVEEWQPGEYLYENAVLRAKEAMKCGTLKGILWHQGESSMDSEADARAYSDRLSKVLNGFRQALHSPNVRIVVGEIGHYLSEWGEREHRPAHWQIVNAELHRLAEVLPNCACVSSAGLTHKGDLLHFSTESLRVLGCRYAEAMKCRAGSVASNPEFVGTYPANHGLFGIGVNQAGWTPASPKWCRIDHPPCLDFVLQTIGTDVTWRTVHRGKWIASEAQNGTYYADITEAAAKPGDYRILCGDERENRGGGGGGLPGGFKGVASFFFSVRDGVYDNLERMLVGYCTWQRCGHRKGWAGCCHQDPVPVKDANGNVIRTIDMRGGYHQSADLRCWHDGISMSMYNLLRYAEKASASWDEDGDIPGNLRWGCDYFLKAIAPEGWLYDCQFVPIGWGPRDYYARPAALGSHANVVMLFARASRYFRPRDAAYADRLLAAAKRLYETMESDPFFETPPKDFVKKLPPGTQPESWYVHQYRTSTLGFAVRSGAALELARVTGAAHYAEQAKTCGLKFVAGLTPDGNSPDFEDCSYTHTVSGLTMPTELYREFRDERFREAALRIAARFVRELTEGNFTPPRPCMSTSWAIERARILAMDADVFGRTEYKVLAQRAFDWPLGSNAMCTSLVEGMGQNQWQRPVFGQFFPSTPQIPGGILHTWGGEYDMPPVTQLLWTLVEL